MAHGDEHSGPVSPDQLSRRALMRRAGQGAIVAGLVWTVPEILTASPAGAQPLSAPPSGGSGGGGPTSGPGPGGGGPGSGGGGLPPGTAGGGGGLPPGTGPGAPSPGPSGAGPSASSATSPAGAGAAGAATAAGSGNGTLAFTGFDPEGLVVAGAGLVAGGWAIQRWASRQEQPPDPEPGAVP